VERRLFGCLTMLGGWCRSTEPSRLAKIARAFRVLIEAEDPELTYTRRCGAELALISHQIPALSAAPLSLRPHPATAREVDALHGYTNPARAGYQLAKLITGLPDELLALIGHDQITADAILGCLVPQPARSIRRAIEERHEPVLDIPWPDPPQPGEDSAKRNLATQEPPAVERDFATALGSLLRGRSVPIPVPRAAAARSFKVRDAPIRRHSRPALPRLPSQPHRALQQLSGRRPRRSEH
jgi:hypothetical protein